MRNNTSTAHAVADALTEVAKELGQPALDTICLENFGKHHFEITLLLDLQRKSGDHAQILDAGGGMGVNLLCLRKLCNPNVALSLVDQFEEYVPGNRMGPQSNGLNRMQEAGVSILHHDIWKEPQLPYEPESFNVITILDVIEHLPGHPFRILAEIRRLLKKGGTLLLSGPNAVSLAKLIKLLSRQHPYMPFEEWCKDKYYSHYREYTAPEYKTIIERCGFLDLKTYLVAEPTRTLARHHYRNGRHRAWSLTSVGLYGMQLIDGLIPSLRPSVYCVATKPDL
jgi:2-polyprenyl-3-methyl-5-hydroxy-6-metoxy-1,4-benzoquinol methylase